MGYFLIPSIVNYAFACELSLKYILQSKKIGYKREHKLNNLYLLLPEEVKSLIYLSINEISNITEKEFNDKLDGIANAFCDWRYFAFDNKNIKIDNSFFIKFCEIVCQLSYKKITDIMK